MAITQNQPAARGVWTDYRTVLNNRLQKLRNLVKHHRPPSKDVRAEAEALEWALKRLRQPDQLVASMVALLCEEHGEDAVIRILDSFAEKAEGYNEEAIKQLVVAHQDDLTGKLS